MKNIALKYIHKSLMETVSDKGHWVKVREGEINNGVAKAYYNSNYLNIDVVYVDYINSQAIILLREGNPLFFYNDNGEKFYQLTTINDIEAYLLYVLIKVLEKDYKIMDLESEVSMLEDIYHNDEEMTYSYLYDESLTKIEKLEKRLERKTKAYDELKIRYEALMEKCNWDI